MVSEPNDPYRQWLGIKSNSRPLNHYELLGLKPFESSNKRIEAAVEKRLSILQLVAGDDAALAQKIIKEVGLARSCLLNANSKTNYDQELKQELEAQSEIKPKVNPGKQGFKESTANRVSIASDDSPGNIQSRIESQKQKEKQDRQVKVIFDRVMWISCGICAVAIAWVMTTRITGCNQDPTTIAKSKDSEKSASKIKSKKISPQKKLDRSLISPLEKEEKENLAKNSGKNQTRKESGKSGRSSTSKNKSNEQATPVNGNVVKFKSLKETIGFFDFYKPVTKNDRLDGLAPLQLKNIKWSKNEGGSIILDQKSQIQIDSEKAFDTIKRLTVLLRFKTDKKDRKQCLFSIKGRLVAFLDKGVLRISGSGKTLSYKMKEGLANNRWHNLAITFGEQTRIWVDGKFVNTGAGKLPDFSKSEESSMVGFCPGAADSKFFGNLGTIGFYWIELDQKEIRSQFAVK